MTVLGSLGNFYVMLLFFFLIGGSGLIAFNISKSFWDKSEKLMDKKGGKFMNKWIKLAITSFTGILIASFALGFTSNLTGADHNSANSAHGAGQMLGQVSPGSAGPSNYGQISQDPMTGSYDARLYQLQVNMMQLQQQLWQITQIHAAQHGSYPGMGGYPYGSMYNSNMGNMNSMNGTNNMSNMSNMSGGGMSMM